MVDMIDEMAGRLEAILVYELIVKVETLKDNATIVDGFECGDNSMVFVA